MKNFRNNFDNKIKYQKYSHYLLPIAIEPLKYGKLIEQFENKYIIQLNTSNILVIKKIDDDNLIKFYRKGDLMIEFTDSKISENIFTRTIFDQKFTFENDKLITSEILVGQNWITIYGINNPVYKDTNAITPLYNENNISKIKKYLENTYIYKNKKAELFILWELFAVFSVFYFCFILFPEDSTNITKLAGYNIIKLRKNTSKNIWNEFVLNFGKKVFTVSLFESKYAKFWENIKSNFNENNHLFILFKIKYINNEFVTIGKLQRLNLLDKQWYFNWIVDNMEFKSEYYNETQIDSIIFSYGFKKGKVPNKDILNENIKSVLINDINIPISLNPKNFGKISKIIEIENGQLFVIQNNKGQIIMFSKFNKFNEIEFLKNGNSLIKFRDELISENKFVRILNNKKYYFENEEQFLLTKDLKTKFISKKAKSKKLINNFITLDIETYIKDNVLIPFCISIFDGKSKNDFYLTDYKNVDELIITALKSIMIRKYNGYNVYMHNMAKFDIIFLFKYLLRLGSVHPVIHNNKIISIDFNFGPNNKYQIKFRDSLLLLLLSLDGLCKSFKIEDPKTIFPIFFVNENNLNYIGEVPDIKYFKNINETDYNNYKNKFSNNWDLKKEAIKYCNLDCISLYQILFKFNALIFNNFHINIHHYPTLPSLAFTIFRSNFMEEEIIPQLSDKIVKDIRSGYTGGAVDMYIPKLVENKKMKCYDVNALYPSQMAKQEMPIGMPTYFKGNILKIDPNTFGFFYCKIIAPDNILHPILQTHVKTKSGTRTISPIGSWEDMMFSEEIKNAKKFGYEFEILWGYTFKSKNIFKTYVEFLFNLRSQYPKSDPMNLIAKILQNSLYGRFGMDDNFPEIDIIHKDYYPDFENKFFDSIIKTTEIEDFYLVEFENINKNDDNLTHDVSIPIAAAITAYSRIHMTQFKNNPLINLYYSDTDSIYVDEDSKINHNLLDNKVLGKLKLENICKEAIFLAPKVYCLKTIEDETIYKVKGLKHEIELTMNDFENLLHKNNILQKSQLKLRKFLKKGHIEVLEQVYSLQVTDNKRKLIYNKNNVLVGTAAYKISFDKIIK